MVRGLDHLVVAVRDLAAAGGAWEALGFTVTPQAYHPWGTTNRLVQLDGFFVEILAVDDPSKIEEPAGNVFSFGAFNRDFLRAREAASMLVLESTDPAGDRADFERLGLHCFDPFSFERSATFKDGSTGQVAFDLTFVRDEAAPDLGFFTCRNRFPDTFWRPEFQVHANGARCVTEIVMVAEDPADHHEFLGGFTGQRDMRATSLGIELKTPRGKISVLTPAAYEFLFGAEAPVHAPENLPALAALGVGCAELDRRHVIAAQGLYGLTLVLDPIA